VLSVLRRAPAISEEAAGLAAGLTTVVLWGSAFVAIRAADASLSPGSIALGRLAVSVVLLSAFAIARGMRMPSRRDVLVIAAYGVLWLGVYSVFLNASERSIDGGTAAMFVSAGTVLIPVLAGVFLHEGFPRRLFAGCAVALVGCALIAFSTAHSRPSALIGIALCAVAVASYAVAVVVQKPVLKRVGSFEVTYLGCAAAFIACLPFLPGLVTEVGHAPQSIGWLIYLGAFPTAIGFATWGFALRRTSAGRAGSLNLLVPVVAVVLGAVLLRELPPVLALVGGALCVGGVVVARRKAA
jgi:drug/metabolite transporter (DMT)-like permease